jgi:flagellar basal body rod protein FlgC
MLGGISSSLAGLNNATQKLSVAAGKIANANIATSKDGNVNIKPPADTNFDEELVNSKLADISYTANAKLLKAQLNSEKEILNILA